MGSINCTWNLLKRKFQIDAHCKCVFEYISKQWHFLLLCFRCETKENQKKNSKKNGFNFIQNHSPAMFCEWQCDGTNCFINKHHFLEWEIMFCIACISSSNSFNSLVRQFNYCDETPISVMPKSVKCNKPFWTGDVGYNCIELEKSRKSWEFRFTRLFLFKPEKYELFTIYNN